MEMVQPQAVDPWFVAAADCVWHARMTPFEPLGKQLQLSRAIGGWPAASSTAASSAAMISGN
jgi:hypothetical protein